jgi:prepilin-type processing-associated H-X9-DG protein
MIELLFVIAAIATMAAILFPVFARARERARKHSCLSNLVNIGFALQMYAADHGGRFPPVEDDLSLLEARYLRVPQVFLCPSSDPFGVPMGAPANPRLYDPKAPPSRYDEPSRASGTSYYYRAGHWPVEAPSLPVVSDQSALHSDQANALYSDGHTASLQDTAWRAAGFRPLADVWPPAPYREQRGGWPGMPATPPGAGMRAPGAAPPGGGSE